MNEPIISIIIPVYNAENFLRQCLDSIIAQTYQKWECILVDDGSTDNSGKICDEYTIKDTRFSVFHKENGGVSSARNLGITNAKGEWIAFVDADDYIFEYYLSQLVKNTDADLIICGFSSSQGFHVLPEDSYWAEKTLSSGIKSLLSGCLLYTPWCKLFKISIIKNNNLLFDTSIRLTEDTVFCYQYLIYTQSVRFIRSDGYFYNGVWGGVKEKYVLSIDEVLLLENALVSSIKKINDKFLCNVDYKYTGYRYYQYINDWYKILTLREVYDYYHKIISEVSWAEFQDDTTFNLLNDSFEIIKNCNSSTERSYQYKFLKNFYENTCLGTKGLNPSVKLFAFLLNNHLHFLNNIYLKLYFIYRSARA